jgi:hypothetical protein
MSSSLGGQILCFLDTVHRPPWTLCSVGDPGEKGTKPRPPNMGRISASSNLRQ